MAGHTAAAVTLTLQCHKSPAKMDKYIVTGFGNLSQPYIPPTHTHSHSSLHWASEPTA